MTQYIYIETNIELYRLNQPRANSVKKERKKEIIDSFYMSVIPCENNKKHDFFLRF